MLFKVIIAIHSDNYKKSLNTLCGQNAQLPNTNVRGTCSNHDELKG